MRVDLDSLCGATVSYRELFECSNSWKTAASEGRHMDNVPRELATFDALRVLCDEIVDPLAARFGRPTITYAFAGPSLTRLVPGQIAPELDQHASHELNSRGELICRRVGAAIDLEVPGVAASELARWIFDRQRFDRLYIYGDDRPLHISVGPDASRVVVEMLPGPSGRRVPRVLRW